MVDLLRGRGDGSNAPRIIGADRTEKAEELLKTGASLILSSCPACDLQLTRMIRKLDVNIKVVDLMRFLDDALS